MYFHNDDTFVDDYIYAYDVYVDLDDDVYQFDGDTDVIDNLYDQDYPPTNEELNSDF